MSIVDSRDDISAQKALGTRIYRWMGEGMKEANAPLKLAIAQVRARLSETPNKPAIIKAVVCLECVWTFVADDEVSVTEVHRAGLNHSWLNHSWLNHSYQHDSGKGHGPVLFIADVWDWNPEPWPVVP